MLRATARYVHIYITIFRKISKILCPSLLTAEPFSTLFLLRTRTPKCATFYWNTSPRTRISSRISRISWNSTWMRSFRIQLQENINSPSTFDELSEALAQIYFQCRFHAVVFTKHNGIFRLPVWIWSMIRTQYLKNFLLVSLDEEATILWEHCRLRLQMSLMCKLSSCCMTGPTATKAIGKVKLMRSTTQVCTINSMIVFHYFIFIFLFLGGPTRSNFAHTCRTNLFDDGCSSRKFFKARDVSIENFQNHFPYIKIHTWFWGLDDSYRSRPF